MAKKPKTENFYEAEPVSTETSNQESLIRGLLEDGYMLGFPQPLESAFLLQHNEEAFETQKKTAFGLMLFAVFVGLAQGGLIWRMTPSVWVVHDLLTWTMGFWLVLGSLSLAMLATRVRQLRPWYIPLRWLTCYMAVLVVQVCSWSLRYAYFGRLSGYLVLLVILAVFGFSRMRMVAALTIVLMATFSALGLALLMQTWPDWLEFFQYMGLSLSYGIFMGALLEYRDRRIFLQERLLEVEKATLEKMGQEQDRLARHDRLTGLINLHYFRELMEREWERALREKHAISLLHMDVKNFSAFNQRYGYAAGDRCLAALARTFEQVSKRAVDVCARYRRDEFLLLLPNTQAQGARAVIDVIEAAVRRLEILHEEETSGLLRVEMGMATMVPMLAQNPEDLLKAAEESLRLIQSSTTDTAIVW